METNGKTGAGAVSMAVLVLCCTAQAVRGQDDPEALRRRLAEVERERAELLERIGDPAEHGREIPQSVLDEAIVVVARGFESDPRTATASISRFTRDDLERRQATHVSDILHETPGLFVVPDGPRGQFTRVFTRGAASNQTLVLVDGIPQNDATTGGGFDWNDLGADAVERVEVLRGSYGVLYGSEAIGGVVNVVTRRGRPGPTRGFVRVEGGSFDTHREVVGISGGDDRVDFALTLGSFRTHGERSREDFESQELNARFGVALSDRVDLDVTLRHADSTVQSPFDFATTGVLPEDGNIERSRQTLSTGMTLTWDAADWVVVRAHGSLLDLDGTFDNRADGHTVVDPDFTPGSGDEFSVVQDELRSESLQTDLRGRLETTLDLGSRFGWSGPGRGEAGLELTVGGELLEQDSRTSSTFPDFNAATSTTSRVDETTRTKSVFAQAELLLPSMGELTGGVLTVGVRDDDHSEFGNETSPFVGARVEVPALDTTLRSAYGEGFRAPKPSELNDPFIGNTDLGAETSTSFDVGAAVRLAQDRVLVEVTWFRLRTDDLIAYDADATSPARPFGMLSNFGRTETRGWEGAVAADLGGGLRLRGSLTTQNPRDRETTLNLPNRAKHFGSAGLEWTGGDWRISLDGFFSGRLPDQGGEVTYPEPAERREPGRRKLVNLTVRYAASEQLTVFGRVENLLDDDWVATPSAPAGAPLGVFLGAQLDF